MLNPKLFSEAFPINKVEVFFDAEDHSNFLGFQWEMISQGRIPIGLDNNDADFNEINKTGGGKEHCHQYGIQYTPFYGALVGADSAINLYDGQSKKFVGTSINESVSTSVNNGIVTQGRNDSASRMEGTTNTTSSSSMPPYIVMAFWKRIA